MADKECCVLTLPLQTENWQEHIIEKKDLLLWSISKINLLLKNYED